MVGLLIDRVVSPPGEPPSGIIPGYNEWPGGDVIRVGSTWYDDGVYAPSSAPARAVETPSETSYIRMATGQQRTIVIGGGGTTGVRGPMSVLPMPIRPPGVLITCELHATWESGHYEENEGEDGPTTGASFTVFLGTADSPMLAVGSGTSAPMPGTRRWRFQYQWTSALPLYYNMLALRANDVPTAEQSVWRVTYVESAAPATGMWRMRQRQSLVGTDSWPLRQRQNGAHTGSWPLRQRQSGV